ncbi:tetratricopeptide repeat protein [Buchnera aphidicola (Muscaphis stroyani)]|uniref:Ancillary SecYEG translocon subunit n=1 Tax=Buchnera aphidicola (Muscaphis stroyani) TaxID=1241869 RepID=A0A4D6Y5E7_9GAMM|nr:tetratricopeptide repeat protein [Buchnera aphidicola]QCI24632.1 tetratricopeptide repeat protein [Buchnera aphidicola (Muscaphis stroyani)]
MIKIFQKNKNSNKKYILIFFISAICIFTCWKKFFFVESSSFDTSKYELIIQKIDIKKPKTITDAETFIIQNNNIYGALTAMFLSKQYVLSNNLNKAAFLLNSNLKYIKEENLKNVLLIRICKIKIQQKKYHEAMNILKNIKNVEWQNIVENMKGDIFMGQNNKKEALIAWEKSKSYNLSNASKEIVNMKINEIK